MQHGSKPTSMNKLLIEMLFPLLLPLLLIMCRAELAQHSGEQHLCLLDKQTGSCQQFTKRWFFQLKYGDCLQFWYGGCGGNDNNFASEHQCVAACQRPSSTRELCRLPAVRGPCEQQLTRWFHDSTISECRQFGYSGCLGNNNNFDSLLECEQKCVTVATPPRATPPRVTPPRATPPRVTPPRVTPPRVTTTTPPPPPPTSPSPRYPADTPRCEQPARETGTCDEYMIRYSFLASYKQCVPFYYGGCGGNSNNFESRQSCIDLCERPMLSTTRWTHAPQQQSVTTHAPLLYQHGTPPAYVRRAHTTQPQYHEKHVRTHTASASDNLCLLDKHQGSCQGYQYMYFYDAQISDCRQFVYTECGGNANRFSTLEECQAACKHHPPDQLQVREAGPANASITHYPDSSVHNPDSQIYSPVHYPDSVVDEMYI